MCGRTSLFVPRSVLEERFDASVAGRYRPRYNIAPGDDLAVIRNDEPGIIDSLEWGLVPHWADDPADSPQPINARAETVAEKPTFRDAFDERRCLVLADGFYEWQERTGGPKQPYRIELEGREPFAMAGLWEHWQENGSELRTVTILTTDANDVVRPIHDRMPVVLDRDEEASWLDAGNDDAAADLDPYEGDDLTAYPISTAVNDPGNDSPAILEPVAVDEQTGLDEF